MNELIARVKTALRISHNRLDSEIIRQIEAARAEMTRVGIRPGVDFCDPLIADAILTWCQYKMAPLDNERYFEAWQYQVDCLRKSEGYRNVQ